MENEKIQIKNEENCKPDTETQVKECEEVIVDNKKLSPKAMELLDTLSANLSYTEYSMMQSQFYEIALDMSDDECDNMIKKVKKFGMLGCMFSMFKLVNKERKEAKIRKKARKNN